MEQSIDPRQALADIRLMMERSTKILSLSGLAGICIGVVALFGVLYAQYIHTRVPQEDLLIHLIADALAVLLFSVSVSVLFSSRMARKKGLPLWNQTGKFLVTELAIPLLAGGVFCVGLLMSKEYALLPAAMLVFYGLALVNASKFTLREVRYLGLAQLTIGLLASLIPKEGLNFWAIGFGIVHIVYGLRVYIKYEK